MNNKLFARIAAAAVGVSMLSTFVFADTAVPTIANGELSFMNGETNIIAATVKDNAAYVTMMSYLISAEEKAAFNTNGTIPAPVDANIIALDQVGLDSLSQLNSVKLLASKLDGTNPAAVVRTGDSNGGGNTWVIALAEDGNSYTITFIAGLGTLKGDNTVTSTDGTVTAIEEVPTTDKAGIKFKHWAIKNEAGAYVKFDFATEKVTADTSLYAVYEMEIGDVMIDGQVVKDDAIKLYNYASITSDKKKKATKTSMNASGYMVGTKYIKSDGSTYEVGDVYIDQNVVKDDAIKLYNYASITSDKKKKATKTSMNASGYMVGEMIEVVNEAE